VDWNGLLNYHWLLEWTTGLLEWTTGQWEWTTGFTQTALKFLVQKPNLLIHSVTKNCSLAEALFHEVKSTSIFIYAFSGFPENFEFTGTN